MEAKIQARIDSELKIQVEQVLSELGMTTAELIRMTFRQVAMQKGIPFDVKIPNKETLAAFEEGKNPEKLLRYPDGKTAIAEMLKD